MGGREGTRAGTAEAAAVAAHVVGAQGAAEELATAARAALAGAGVTAAAAAPAALAAVEGAIPAAAAEAHPNAGVKLYSADHKHYSGKHKGRFHTTGRPGGYGRLSVESGTIHDRRG
eukprot:GHVU01032796.1.p1 GENE.GHVU01032796.1~~GHVU01032796.1.p1  ORF type:complete len:117 (+),score=17.60 GHVU01032796.1:578-928(+)